MLHHLVRLATVGGLMVSAAACGASRSRSGVADALIVFENQSLNQADVFLVRSPGDALRIGTVFGGRREVLRVPYSRIAASPTVTVVARMRVSSRQPRTGTITLAPGKRIMVTLPADERLLSALEEPPPP